MKTLLTFCLGSAASIVALLLFTGCESTDGGGTSVSGGVYYGVGFYDPWYYGGYYGTGVIVAPPPGYVPPAGSQPPGERPVKPEQPIAKPPSSPRPTPSIPSTPRPMARPAMRR
jgi:hypothetical protein